MREPTALPRRNRLSKIGPLIKNENICTVQSEFYKKLKNVSCEYDGLNGWNATLQSAWYIIHVCMIWFLWTKPQLWVRPIEWLKLNFAKPLHESLQKTNQLQLTLLLQKTIDLISWWFPNSYIERLQLMQGKFKSGSRERFALRVYEKRARRRPFHCRTTNNIFFCILNSSNKQW